MTARNRWFPPADASPPGANSEPGSGPPVHREAATHRGLNAPPPQPIRTSDVRRLGTRRSTASTFAWSAVIVAHQSGGLCACFRLAAVVRPAATGRLRCDGRGRALVRWSLVNATRSRPAGCLIGPTPGCAQPFDNCDGDGARHDRRRQRQGRYQRRGEARRGVVRPRDERRPRVGDSTSGECPADGPVGAPARTRRRQRAWTAGRRESGGRRPAAGGRSALPRRCRAAWAAQECE
jgi:hypothetical protein